ncbi:DUF1844 domain-containing protein [Syntrophus aciditrophicus]|jgi:hypothetical protein|nr:DUF1844 domain-containing protein [Syntrophus aciditrophicus]
MEEEKQEKSFVVKDKRIFSESGEKRQPEPEKPEAPSAASEEPKAKPSPGKSEEKQEQILPEVNFLNFVLSLSTTVMFHFGDFPDPVTREIKKNIPAAKQTIDILSMLKDKTKGNLDDQENSVLEEILYELKMRYVKETS